MILFLDAIAFFFMARGFIEELGRLLGLLFSSIVALNFYIAIGTFLSGIIAVDPWAVFVICFIIIFLLTLFCIRLLTKVIHFMFLSGNTKWVNKILGTFFGFTKGVLLVMMFFWIFEVVPITNISSVIINNSVVAKKLVNTRKSVISTFHWDDPVIKGETAINNFLKKMDAQNE